MFPYADYEFYTTKANGELEKGVFESEILEASFFLRYLTLGKSDRNPSKALSYAACAIADMYAAEKRKITSGERQKKSENNDGYSVSFVTELKDGESTEELLARKARQIARQYLACTDLLSRKVGCRNDY
ncbi:hypothetical protein AALA13_05220 [Lachnospiraceae bacterium 50-23]